MSILREGWGGLTQKAKGIEEVVLAMPIEEVVLAMPDGTETAFPFDDDGRFMPGGTGGFKPEDIGP